MTAVFKALIISAAVAAASAASATSCPGHRIVLTEATGERVFRAEAFASAVRSDGMGVQAITGRVRNQPMIVSIEIYPAGIGTPAWVSSTGAPVGPAPIKWGQTDHRFRRFRAPQARIYISGGPLAGEWRLTCR